MRRITRITLVVLALLGVWDLTRPPADQIGAATAVLAIRAYQSTASPLVRRLGVECRFTPSCSRYVAAVIERDGLLAGTWRALVRVARCGPWTPRGTVDEP